MSRHFNLICGVLTLAAAAALHPTQAAAQFEDNVAFASDEGNVTSPISEQLPRQPQSITAPRNYYTGASAPEAPASDPLSAAPIADSFGSDNQGIGGDCQCGDCGCNACCNSCFPRWYVNTEAIFLWRNNDVTLQPVVETASAGITLLDSRTADFDTGVGPRMLVGLRTSECTAWEGQYFSALAMSGRANVSIPGFLSAAGQFSQLSGWSIFDAANVDTNSELHNAEVNYVRSWNRFSLLGGFRFVRLTESYGLDAIGFSSNVYDIHCENDLYGGQLGARWRECCGQFYWEFTGKAGVFGNDSNQSQFLTSGDGATVQRDFTSYENCVAFVGDLNLSVGFRFSKVWSARCGYNVMWIDQVALAADQLNFNISPDAGRNYSPDGDVFLHGINVGLEGRWQAMV